MDPVRNPLSPGAGRRPAALVGRDRQTADWDVRLSRIEQGRDAPAALARTTWIWVLGPQRSQTATDVDDVRAADTGSRGRLAAGNDPAISIAWAARLRAVGVEALWYHGRFSTSLAAGDAAIAVFGPEHEGLGALEIRSVPMPLDEVDRAAGVKIATRSAHRNLPATVDVPSARAVASRGDVDADADRTLRLASMRNSNRLIDGRIFSQTVDPGFYILVESPLGGM